MKTSEGLLLEAAGLTKRFGGLTAVDGASFRVAAGSITALIGPNGAGKTTAFNLLSGFLRPDGGTIRFDGRRIDRRRPHTVVHAGLVRTFQTPRVLTRMSVLENLMLAAPSQPGELFGAALVVPRLVRRREERVGTKARETLGLLRLDKLAGDYAGTLSGGQRKLLELGRALMTDATMVLLDEPLAGVNPVLAEQLLEHIAAMRRDRGITFFVIEHDMDVVMTVSDRVIVMDEGKVIAEGAPADVQGNERVIEAYLGRRAPEAAGPEPAGQARR